ncbi:hypothetical protein D9M71_388660 [compost metagenome]
MEITFLAGISDPFQATEHPDHANLLNHFAQNETCVLLHVRGRILAEIGVLGRDENLHHAQHHDQAQRHGDQQLDQAKTPAAAPHGITIGSMAARLLRMKLRRESAVFAARESSQVIVMVYTCRLTVTLPVAEAPSELTMLALKSNRS